MSTITKAKPTDSRDYLGLEIEFDVPERPFPISRIKDQLDALVAENKAFKGSIWRVDHEHIAYAGDKSFAGEIAGLMLRDDKNWPEQVRKITEFLKFIGSFVDERCGLHVHLDARNTSDRLIEENLAKLIPTIRSFCSKHRNDNPNLGSPLFDRRGRYETLEVRFMEANFDSERIIDYINFLVTNGYSKEGATATCQ